ncbi:MAG: replication initiator protein [Microviridae sp.]|nr:MAG: replication initiator protein [Microviridae sp.]
MCKVRRCVAASGYDMPCYSPLVGYKSSRLTDNGKRKFVSKRTHGFVDLSMTVPCGQCIGCRIDRSRSWALRCVHEAKFHTENCFLTLTYDDENVPLGGTLVKKDLQLFFKRCRNAGINFRYFACGEYGEVSNRPHYHALMFGHAFVADRKQHSRTKKGDVLYTSATLSALWPFGHSIITAFSYATAAYTARYVMKKQIGKKNLQHEQYSRFDHVTGEEFFISPEFALMSLKPGLGSSWYEKFKSDAFPSDFLVHEGKKHPVPKYYSDKLKKEAPDEHDEIRKKRVKARSLAEPDNTPERLFTKMEVKKSKLKSLVRSLK